MAEKIILDCDPGIDDAAAIMLAAANPGIEILAITTVAGNQGVEKTSHNALRLCSDLDIDTRIAKGMDRPILREPVNAGNVHGESGLDGPVFGPVKKSLDKLDSVDLIISLLRDCKEPITLVPIGPLTNIAMAINLAPDIIPKIKQIVLMGGSCGSGNITPSAEFNMFADPEAGYVVFKSGRPIVMMGLDVTRKVRATEDVIAPVTAIGNRASRIFTDMMGFYGQSQKNLFGSPAPAVHDPVTIAWLFAPELITLKPYYVEVEIEKGLCYGRTVCDVHGVTGNKPNAQVALDIDAGRFWELFTNNIKSLP